jgi:WD40 repeat protein
VAFSDDGRRVLTTTREGPAIAWDFQADSCVTPLGESKPYLSAAFGPDGRHVVIGGRDKKVLIWDFLTGKRFTWQAHDGDVVSALYSSDGGRIVTASRDRTAKVWDAASGKELARFTHEDEVLSAAFSKDGRRVVTAACDKAARIWDAETGKLLTHLDHDAMLFSAEFSPEGNRVVTVCGDNAVRVWDVATAKPIATLSHPDGVNSATFFPDNLRILTAGWDGIRVWDAETGKQLVRESPSPVLSAVPSPDGRRVAAASTEGIAFHDPNKTGANILNMAGRARSVGYSPDGRLVVSVQWHGNVWVQEPGLRGKTIELDENSLDCGTHFVEFSPDGTRVVTADADAARIWDADTGRELNRLGHGSNVGKAVFDSNGRRVFTTGADKTARAWDSATGRELFRLPGIDAIPYSVRLSESGRIILCNYGATSCLHDADTGKLLTKIDLGTSISGTEMSSDGRRVLALRGDKMARIWDAENGREIARFPCATVYPVRDDWDRPVFSADGRWVVSSKVGGPVQVRGVNTGDLLADPDAAFLSTLLKPVDRRRIARTQSGTILWDTISGKKLAYLSRDIWEHAATFSTDGQRFAMAHSIHRFTICDSETGRELLRLGLGEVFNDACRFSRDGRRVVTTNSGRRPAGVWKVEWPALPDDSARVRAFVRARTGYGLDDEGNPRWQSIDQQQTALRELDERGGAWLPPFDAKEWHLRRAEEFERELDWFAARFHWNQMVRLDPNNAEYRRRRDNAEAEWTKAH